MTRTTWLVLWDPQLLLDSYFEEVAKSSFLHLHLVRGCDLSFWMQNSSWFSMLITSRTVHYNADYMKLPLKVICILHAEWYGPPYLTVYIIVSYPWPWNTL